MFSREQLMSLLSRMSPQDVQNLRNILSETENDQGFEPGSELGIGIDILRTMVTENQYFTNSQTEIIDEDGRIARIKSMRVWDCGHGQEWHSFGGIDSFGHAVCKHCLRWCDRGNHPCCVLDSKQYKNGRRVCRAHQGIKWIFFKPKFIRDVK